MCNFLLLLFLQNVLLSLLLYLFFQFKSNSFIDFIPNYRKNNNAQINIQDKNEQIKINSELEQKLRTEIEKNKKLEDEIKKLKDSQKIYKEENKKLNEDLVKAKKIIEGIQNNQIGNNEIKKLKDEIEYLKYQLNNKDNEINELKRKIKNEKPKFDFDDVMWIYFQPIDNSFKEGIKCLKTNTFAEVEEKLYKKYNTLRNTNNNFTANATPVLRFKTIEENKIKDHDIIILYKKE